MQNLFMRSIEIANMLGLSLGALGLFYSSKRRLVKVLSFLALLVFGFLLSLFIVLLIRDIIQNGINKNLFKMNTLLI